MALGLQKQVHLQAQLGLGIDLGRASIVLRAMNRLNISNITFSSGQLQTYYFKFEAEAPFNAVRIRIYNRQSGAIANWSGVVAATETALRDTTAHMFEPVVGGIPYNSIASSGPGWRSITNISASVPAGNALTSEQYVESDWISCPSVARADGSPRPLLLVRLAHDGSVASHTLTQYIGAQIIGDRHDVDYARINECQTLNSDGVSNLATEPTSYIRTSASELAPLISIEYRLSNGVKPRVFHTVGDSITGGVGSSSQNCFFDGWLQEAVMGISTPDAPCIMFNDGLSGQTSATYTTNAIYMLQNGGVTPTDIVMPSSSPNDSLSSNANIDTYFGLIDQVFAAARAINPTCKRWIWKSIPRDNYDIPTDTVRLYSHSKADAYLAAGKCDVVADANSAVSNFATPQRMNSADGLHPDPSMSAPLAAKIKAQARPSFGPVVTNPTSFFTGYSWSQVGNACRVRPAQVAGTNIVRSYQWYLAGVLLVGATSVTSPTWASGDIGKVPTCVETISGDGPTVTSTATFPAVIAASSNMISSGSNTFTGYNLNTAASITFATGAADPFGGTNATTLTEDSTSNSHGVSQPSLATFTLNSVYLVQLYAKAGTQTALQLCFDSSRFGSLAYANFDLSQGVPGVVGSGLQASGILPCEEVPGWYLCYIVAQCTSGGTGRNLFSMSNNPGNSRLQFYQGAGKTLIWYNGQDSLASAPQAPIVT